MAKRSGNILIVDDNEEILVALRLFLSNHFAQITTEKNPVQIPALVQKTSFDVILLDMNFKAGINTGNEGIFWMREILKNDPDAVIIFMTAFADIELAVRAIREGATDFIEKPWEEDKLLARITAALQLRQSKLEINRLKSKQKHLSERIDREYPLCIGSSAAMQQVFSTIAKVAKTDANILILGENGTGKELVAREIHRQSKRASEVFVNVDLGAITESIFESELFGYVKGAFTDARQDRAGRFEIASGGTLFLDEIGNLPLHLQSKLLAVLQNREVIRLGSNKPILIDIRLISATNKPIFEMAEKDTFREDLLYRINTIQIELPSLRERIDDIPELVDSFLKEYTGKYAKNCNCVSTAAIAKLKRHKWQGNVRELQHTVEKAVILCESNTLDVDDFFFHSMKNSPDEYPDDLSIAANEKRLIRKAMGLFQGNITKTCIALGITRKTLYNKIKKYDL
jgi:two-component system response regulator HydG